MDLGDMITLDGIIPVLRATSKKQALQELAQRAQVITGIASREIFETLLQRERLGSTGLGRGIAIPHGKCAGMNGIAMAIGKPAQPIDFEAIDGKPVRLIVLLASPPDRPSDHIQALARISKLISMDDFREQVYAAASSQDIYNPG